MGYITFVIFEKSGIAQVKQVNFHKCTLAIYPKSSSKHVITSINWLTNAIHAY